MVVMSTDQNLFDEYSASRVSVRRELQGGHNQAWTNVLSHYVALLLSMLKHQVLHHSDAAATATLETVAMAMDQVPGVMHTVGGRVLSQSGAGGYRQTLQMLKLMYTWKPSSTPLMRVSLLLETAVYMASHGNLQEAYFTLQSQINTEPFKSDVLVHGCSAVLQYLMWRKEVGLNGGGGAGSEKLKRLSEQALQHFAALEELPTKPCHAMDIFISAHSQLLVELGRNDEALELLISHRADCPTRIVPHRMVCDYVKEHCSAAVLPEHLSKLVELDQSCDEAVQLAHCLLQSDCTDYEAVLEVLLHYLDYPHNRRNEQAWKLLHTVQQKWPSYQDADMWTDRMKWWSGTSYDSS